MSRLCVNLRANFQVGGVAKWPKATVCKTVIRRFESGRRLFFFIYNLQRTVL